jgi:HAD superfamily hydrolase (TIGR01509 family)
VIRHLIWDVDGTLFDTYPAIVGAFCSALAELGHSSSREQVAELAAISIGHCAEVLAPACGVEPGELLQRFSAHYRAIPPEEQPPFPGAAALCAHIRAQGGLNVIVTHRGRESTKSLLAAHGLSEHFAGIVAGDDGYPRKPDPAAFLAVMAAHGLAPEETLAIGDREIDVLAGRAAGVRTCLFGTPAEGTAADEVVSDLAGVCLVGG